MFERLRLRLRERIVPAALVAVLLFVAIGAAISLLGSTPSTSSIAPKPSTSAAPLGVLYVHVTGAVLEPGLVTLPIGARVVDAIAAAGGCTAEADQSALNLARELRDGEQLNVPIVGQAPAPGAQAGGLINLNSADQATLETLPHVGPALAQRIIAYRDEHGGFASVDELAEVSGIGDKIFADLVDLVTV